MNAAEREAFYLELIRQVSTLQRNYERVYPRMLVPRISIRRCEQQLRKDMSLLARRGDLIRIGGPRARRGYAAPRTCRAA